MQPESKSSRENTRIDFEDILTRTLKNTAGRLGEDFLTGLVEQLCRELNLDFALIGKWQDEQKLQIKTLAAFGDGHLLANFTYPLANSPCEVTESKGIYCVPTNVQQTFPNDKVLQDMGAQGYLGVMLRDSDNQSVGLLVTASRQPLQQIELITSVLQIFAYRVSAELERRVNIKSLKNEVAVSQAMLDATPALMFMLDKQGNFLRWNRYYYSKFGYNDDHMKTHDTFTAIDQADRTRVKLELENIFATGSGTLYINGLTSQGETVPLLATAQTCIYEGNQVVVGVALDMTEQQTVEHHLLRSQGRLARKNSQLGLINTLLEGLHTSRNVNHIAEQVINLLKTIEEGALLAFSLVDTKQKRLFVAASSDMGANALAVRNSFPIKEQGSPTSIAMRTKKLEVFADVVNDKRIAPNVKKNFIEESVKSCLVLPLYYQDKALGAISIGFRYDSVFPADEVEFFNTIGSSIALAVANARQFELMKALATQDSLTGLPNRNALTIDSEIAIKINHQNRQCMGIILIDLDRFKEINDTLDHQIGDKLLQLLGPRIEKAINDPLSSIYRLGGDEFCVLVRDKKKAKEISAIAELIKQAIEVVFEVDGLNLEISSSIGVVTTKGRRYNATEMLRCVELAMYHAKNTGGGISHFTPALDADTEQRFVIMAEMAEAIRSDQLILRYQPKYDLASQQIVGCEALVRWQHKDYGLLPPDKFIPLIELTQLIQPLTLWVIKTAFSQLKSWKNEGLKLQMAINLSTRNLTDDDFIEQLDILMAQYEIAPNEIEFEVTETALVSNLDRASRQLTEFKKRDIQCSLDDYGTGYSSLSYIKKMPLDTLKIDRSFITQMVDNSTNSIIAKSTIDLAHSLGLKVIAEGVEDQDTLIALLDQGCDMVQGYHICEPVDAETLAKLYWQYQAYR